MTGIHIFLVFFRRFFHGSRLFGYLRVYLFLRRFELFFLNELRNDELVLYVLDRRFLVVLSEIGVRNLEEVEIILQLQALIHQLILEFLHERIDLSFDHRLRDLHLGILRDRLQNAVFGSVRRTLIRALLQSFLGLCLVRFYRFAARRVLDELVGKLGKLLALQGIELHVEHRGLTLKVFRLIIFGEGNVDVLFLADRHTHDLIFKPGNELTAAERKIEALRFAAVELHAVHRAHEIDICDIAVLRRSVRNRHLACVSIEQSIELRLDLLVLNSIRVLLDFHTLIRGNFYLRIYGNDRRKHDLLVLELIHGNLGLADEGILFGFLFDRLIVALGKKDIQAVLVKYALAVNVLDNVLGRLALTEAVHREFISRFHVRLRERVLPFLTVELEGDLDGAFFRRFGSVFHNYLSPAFICCLFFVFLPSGRAKSRAFFRSLVYFTTFIKENKAFLFTISQIYAII